MFIGREKELADSNEMYLQDKFQLSVLYGRKKPMLLRGTEEKHGIYCFPNQDLQKL